MAWITDPQAWIALVTLTALEIVLGIDNVIFISVLVARLPPGTRDKARILGLALAMLTRIALLLSIAWVMGLTRSLFSLFSQEISGKDIILVCGGVFLLWKSTVEIHKSIEGEPGERGARVAASGFVGVVVQIALLDIVFSLDSVITAVGMANEVMVMIIAIILAVIVMMISSGSISNFVHHHPTIKILALSFLVLIGVALIADGFEFHIPKGYIYFAMAFSVGVEMLNTRMRKKTVART